MTYSKPCQIDKMIEHIEKPDKIRTVYSIIFRIFRDIQQYSATIKGH